MSWPMSQPGPAASPRSLAEIAALSGGFRGKIAYIAGGTDLIIAHETTPWPDLIIDLSHVRALDFIEIGTDAIRIGAATTLATLAGHPGLGQSLRALGQAAAQVGSAQIRNRASIGGNIATAVAGGDLLPVLKCLDARIEILRRGGGVETCAFGQVVSGHGQTSLGNGDLIRAVILPLASGPNRRSAFAKIGRRQTLTIARLNLAVLADFDRARNRVNDICVVAGAIAPVPQRLHALEAAVRARTVDQALADDFVRALGGAVDAAIPGRASRPYKRRAVIGLGLDLLSDLFGREFALPPGPGARA